jgi:hypothetical protein
MKIHPPRSSQQTSSSPLPPTHHHHQQQQQFSPISLKEKLLSRDKESEKAQGESKRKQRERESRGKERERGRENTIEDDNGMSLFAFDSLQRGIQIFSPSFDVILPIQDHQSQTSSIHLNFSIPPM